MGVLSPRLDIGILQARAKELGACSCEVLSRPGALHAACWSSPLSCTVSVECPWSEASADSDFRARALAFRPGEVTLLPTRRNFNETSLQDQPRHFHEGSAEEFRSLRSQTLPMHGPSCVVLVQVVGAASLLSGPFDIHAKVASECVSPLLGAALNSWQQAAR